MTNLSSATVVVLLTALVREVASAELPPPSNRQVSFSQDVRPILETSCVNCHGRGRAKGRFQLDTRETTLKGGSSGIAVKPGNSAESLLIELVAGLDPDNIMPAKGKPLTPEQVGILRAWIDQGVQWDEAVTFARRIPSNLNPRQPALRAAAPGLNPIDNILSGYLASKNVAAAKPVEDRLYVRRVYLDIIGLLPTPEQIDSFTADTSRGKRAALVDRLLSDSDAYAQHWLSFWNDLLRNDYKGTGYIDGGRKQITQWLYSALRTNMPYDRFVAQLVNPGADSEGFVKGILWRGVVNASQTPEMQAAQNISQVFMGVNMKCASCHDSFVNEWKLSDAYGLAAVYSDNTLELFQCDKPTGKTASAAFIYPDLGDFNGLTNKSERIRRLEEILTSNKNGRLPRTIVNRLWARFFGYGLVEPIDDMEAPAWNQDLMDWLAEDLVAGGYDLKRTIRTMLISSAYQMPAVAQNESKVEGYVFRGPLVRRLSAEQFRDAISQLTGVWGARSYIPGMTNNVRAALTVADPLTSALGRPNREQVVTRRVEEATTLQALELTNGSTLAQILSKGADYWVQSGLKQETLVSQLYRTALGRTPTEQERSIALQGLTNSDHKASTADVLWAVAMHPEFQLVY